MTFQSLFNWKNAKRNTNLAVVYICYIHAPLGTHIACRTTKRLDMASQQVKKKNLVQERGKQVQQHARTGQVLPLHVIETLLLNKKNLLICHQLYLLHRGRYADNSVFNISSIIVSGHRVHK